MALSMCEVGASIHGFDVTALPDHVEIPTSWDDYIDSRIQEWTDAEKAYADSNPFMRLIASYLRANKPPPAPLTLVHGDFQIANILIADDGYYMVDWELAHVGDPREDLGWMMFASVTQPPDVIAEDPDAFYARYRELTGLVGGRHQRGDHRLLRHARRRHRLHPRRPAVRSRRQGRGHRDHGDVHVQRHRRHAQRAHERHEPPPCRHRRFRMIAKPSTAQLIEAVNAELASKVSPELDAGTTRVVLDMAMAVLQGAATRSANELAWMREEEHAVAAVAERLVASSRRPPGWPRPSGPTPTTAPTACTWPTRWPTTSGSARCCRAPPRRCTPTAIPAGSPPSQELFDQRLANENAVIGAFQAVGRT